MLAGVFAFLISLIAPGSGQLFNGQYFKAALILGFFIFGKTVLLPLLIRIINFKERVSMLKFIYRFNILYPIIMLLSAIDAALKAPQIYHGAFTFLFAIITAIIAAGMYKNLQSAFIINSLSGLNDITPFILGKKNKQK